MEKKSKRSINPIVYHEHSFHQQNKNINMKNTKGTICLGLLASIFISCLRPPQATKHINCMQQTISPNSNAP